MIYAVYLYVLKLHWYKWGLKQCSGIIAISLLWTLFINTFWYFVREVHTKEVSGINSNSYFLGVCLTLLALTVNFCISLQLFPLMLVCMTMTFGQISPEDCIIMHLRMTIFFVSDNLFWIIKSSTSFPLFSYHFCSFNPTFSGGSV